MLWWMGWIGCIHAVDALLERLLQDTPTILFPDWNINQWETVDDRIRGGSSQSYLKQDNQSIVFYGVLDTSTLGGAGFCSQRFLFNTSFVLQGKAIQIELGKADAKTYALNLVDVLPQDRGDGRKKSQLQFKSNFVATPNTLLRLPYTSFRPYFRGKPQDTDTKLGPVVGLSLMMQSYFDQQSGPFELEIKSILLVNE